MNNVQPNYRRTRASVASLHINLIHNTNPWVVVAWSVFFPGAGHFLLGQYVLGWMLFIWEIGINVYTKFNTAIMYSLTGRYYEAKQLLAADDKWLIVSYGGVFVFTLISSYKMAVETNELYYLADKENQGLKSFAINALQYNYLNKRSPMVGALWSLIMPSLGSVWTHRVVTGVFELALWVVILVQSKVLAGIEYTALGHFQQAHAVVNSEWLLFVPSVYSFLFYYTYVTATEENKLFDKEQANFLAQNYQVNPNFRIHLKDDETNMRFIASFNHSIYVEKVIANLESIGIPRASLFATSMDRKNQRSVWFDTLQRSDGKALMDGVALLGGLGCALGTIYGFVLMWGPVLWGIIGFLTGCLFGLIIKLIQILAVSNKQEKLPPTEVFIIVDCEKSLEKTVENILWSNKAFGISIVGQTEDIS